MSAKPNYFFIGLFVALGLAVLAGGLIAFGAGQIFRPKIYLETYVDGSVQGIDIGSPVKFRGVQVGKVSAVGFLFTVYGMAGGSGTTNYVVIDLEIDREIFPDMFDREVAPVLEREIANGLRVQIEPQGITGLNYMEINFVDPKRFPPLKVAWTPRFDYIPSAPGELTNFIDSINNIMREIEQLNISGMSEAGMNLLENLNTAVTGAQVEKVSADLQTLIADLRQALDAAKIGDVSADARKLIGNIDRLADHINKSNSDLRALLKNLEPATRISGPKIRAIIDNIEETSANLEQLSREVKRKPSLLLWGTPPAAKPSPSPRSRPRPRPSPAAYR